MCKTHQHEQLNRQVQNRLPLRQTGFSLVELMVGLVIGLLATLVIMQVFSAFEGQKRTTSGTSDAQTAGNISIYGVTRDLQLAGYGLPVMETTNSSLGCTAFSPAVTNLSPVTIVDGGAVASDTITVRYGTSSAGGFAIKVTDVTNKAGGIVGVDNNISCQVGDTALIVNGSNCVLQKVTGPTQIASPPINTGDTTHYVLDNAANANIAVDANISCLGDWGQFTYTITANQLARNGAPIADGIVNLQAQYGISAAANSNVVTQWVNATSPWTAAELVASVANRNRIKAVRVALVARNELREKNVVTNACTTAKGVVNIGPCAWDDSSVSAAPKIDISNLGADWQNYRYRTYETIIPIRNIIWSRDKLS